MIRLSRTRTTPIRRNAFRPRLDPLEGRALLSAGSLDTSFGGTGMVAATYGGKVAQSEAVAAQPDGKVVVVGYSQSTTPNSAGTGTFTVVRYNANGSLDTSFGSGGIDVIPIAGENYGAQAYAVAIQPDGKILVAGYAATYDKKEADYYSDWAIVRLNTNGSLDTSFGTKGCVTTRLTPDIWIGENWAASIDVQANGQILVGGWLGGYNERTSSGTQGLALVRYNANGSLDTSFGSGGEVIDTAMIYNSVGPMTMAIDSSGRIAVAGLNAATDSGAIVTRFLSNGTLDPTFGSGGMVNLPQMYPNGVALQSTGQIMVYGGSSTSSGAVMVRLNTNGSLDTTFGTDGVYSDPRLVTFRSVVIQPTNDEIVAVGVGIVIGEVDFNDWVTRVLANGSGYDPSFGSNGLSEANFNNSSGSYPTSVVLDASGNILVAGVAMHYNGSTWSYYFATARFLG